MLSSFALTFALASLGLLGGFIGASVWRFGLQKSYSAYSDKWTALVPINDHTHLWSIVTIVVAILMVPALLERAADNPWQCLGFLAPLWFIGMALTPEYQHKHKQMVAHVVMSVAFIAGTLAYIIFGLKLWFALALSAAAFALVAFATGTERTSTLFWFQCALFSAIYIVIFLPAS